MFRIIGSESAGTEFTGWRVAEKLGWEFWDAWDLWMR
jgi:hypothetical protein